MTITCGRCGNTFKSFAAYAAHPCALAVRLRRIIRMEVTGCS